MSAVGPKLTRIPAAFVSAFWRKADVLTSALRVRFWPKDGALRIWGSDCTFTPHCDKSNALPANQE